MLDYGPEGLVSTSCDVYSLGMTLMETFTKRRPKDEMFTEELSLQRWVQECLPDFVIQLMDMNLVHLQDEPVKNKIACISSILELALCCTADASKDRMTMNDVLKHSRRLNFNSLGLKPLKQVYNCYIKITKNCNFLFEIHDISDNYSKKRKYLLMHYF